MSKYVNGYLPKIEYWTNKANECMRTGNTQEYWTALNKVLYFKQRQEEVYG